MRKAGPYRFVPQTSHPTDLFGRELRGSGFRVGAAFCRFHAVTGFDLSGGDLVAEELACRRGERLVFSGLRFVLPPGAPCCC